MKWTQAEVMCYRKRRFASVIQASCAIGRIKGKDAEAALLNWHTYECPVCRGYHITKQSQDNPEYQKRRYMAGLPVTR